MMAAKRTGTVARYLRGKSGKPMKVKLGGKVASGGNRKVPLATIRCKELDRFITDRFGRRLPDTEEGRKIAKIMLDHIHYRQAVDRQFLMNDWLDRRGPSRLIGEDRDAMIARVFRKPELYKPARLGALLGLTYARRERLRIRTIREIDRTDEQREAMQKMKDATRQAAKRREAGCMTREEYENASITRLAKVLGISRRTWYRRQKEAADQARLHYASDGPVPRVSHAVVTVRAN